VPINDFHKLISFYSDTGLETFSLLVTMLCSRMHLLQISHSTVTGTLDIKNRNWGSVKIGIFYESVKLYPGPLLRKETFDFRMQACRWCGLRLLVIAVLPTDWGQTDSGRRHSQTCCLTTRSSL